MAMPGAIDKNTPIDQMIRAFWDICDGALMEWEFDFAHDQWWWFAARCEHHPWQGERHPLVRSMWHAESEGLHDLSTAILEVYELAEAAHR